MMTIPFGDLCSELMIEKEKDKKKKRYECKKFERGGFILATRMNLVS